MSFPPIPQNSKLLDLSPTDWQQFRHQPMVAAFLLYLEHLALAYRRELMELWEANQLKPDQASEIRGAVMMLEQISNLPLDTIRRFYLGDSATPADEATPRRAAGG